MKILWDQLKLGSWKLPRKQLCHPKSRNFLYHLPIPIEERAWGLNRFPIANDIISHAYVIEASIILKTIGLGEFLTRWIHGDLERVVCLKGMEALNPFPIPCPIHFFLLAIPELYPLIINWYLVSKMWYPRLPWWLRQ